MTAVAAPGLAGWFRRAWPIVVLLELVLVGVILTGRVLAGRVVPDAAFSINAVTGSTTVDVTCGHQLVWTLPRGRIAALPALGQPDERKAVTVTLRSGSRAKLLVRDNGRLSAEFGLSPDLHCGAAGAAVTGDVPESVQVDADGSRVAPTPSGGFLYESTTALADAPMPVLLLKGRVVVGEEIQFGAGAASQITTPILVSGRIEARAPDDDTGQRRLIHEESVDAGGLIDTHGCLDAGAEGPHAVCADRLGWTVEGFVHGADPDAGRHFQVQLQVVGRHVGVRQQGSAERLILVSWWSLFTSSARVQISVAALFALMTIMPLLALIGRLLPARWFEALQADKPQLTTNDKEART